MGQAAGAGAAGSSLASVGLQAYSQVLQGEGTKAADNAQADRLDRSAQYGTLKADQISGQRMEQLNTQLGNIESIRAAAHTDPSSPTGAAIRDYNTMVSQRETNTEVENVLAQKQQNEADSAYLRKAGNFALLTSDISAGATVAKGVGQGLSSPLFGVK